ncbi:MAG: YqeG family HAD IIIA-type phosphatase, partial [Spirulina sp. SIO3F2]|nr:YqeG family HAD IIIA-type phosphatase [Spirulina sp. SIO3F2]
MTMWEQWLKPNLVLGETIVGLTPEIIAEHQLQGLILDVDETLVPLKQSQ